MIFNNQYSEIIIINSIELYIFYIIRFYHLQVIIFRNFIGILEEISKILQNLIIILSLVEISNRFLRNHLVEIVSRTIFIKEIRRKLDWKKKFIYIS